MWRNVRPRGSWPGMRVNTSEWYQSSTGHHGVIVPATSRRDRVHASAGGGRQDRSGDCWEIQGYCVSIYSRKTDQQIHTDGRGGASGCCRAAVCSVVEELCPAGRKSICIAVIGIHETVIVASCPTGHGTGFIA